VIPSRSRRTHRPLAAPFPLFSFEIRSLMPSRWRAGAIPMHAVIKAARPVNRCQENGICGNGWFLRLWPQLHDRIKSGFAASAVTLAAPLSKK
jgi:hypothetical protein